MAVGNADELLDFAIQGEQEAHDFYLDLAERVERPAMKELLRQFAREEAGHKRKLEGIKKGSRSFPYADDVVDLKIADYLVDVEPKGDLTYQEALILAMKREKAAFKLYTDLAALTADKDLKIVFQSLAQEEAKHKLRFELEYDDKILSEN
jgi:rubrerythrin